MPNVGDVYEYEYTSTQGTSITASGIGAGEFDGGQLAYSSFATAVQEGIVPSGMKIVNPGVWYGPDFGFSDPYCALTDSGISTFDDLPGTRFATNVAGSGSDIAARIGLVQEGIDPQSDLEMVEVGFGAMPAALEEGRIDVGTLLQPLMEPIWDQLTVIYDIGTAFGNFLPFFDAFSEEYLDENPEAVSGYIEDSWVAAQWVFDNQSEAVPILAEELGVDERTVEVTVFGDPDRDYPPNYTWAQKFEGLQMEGRFIQPGIDGMVDTGFLDSSINMSDMIDNSYLPEDARQLPSALN